jgi:8-oxo-dGTP diphosphatase
MCVQGTEAKLMEPHKCGGWSWCDWNDIPKPRFLPLQQLLDTGHNPFSDTR